MTARKRPVAEKAAGVILTWYEFICGTCGDSEVIHGGGTKRGAIRAARVMGWKKMRSPAGLLWVCPIDARGETF